MCVFVKIEFASGQTQEYVNIYSGVYLRLHAPFAYPEYLHTRIYLHACIFGACELDLREICEK